MSDELVRVAVLGTAQATGASAETGTAIDALVSAEGRTVERVLLLRAGASSVHRAAGFLAPAAPTLLDPCEPDPRRELSGEASASLVSIARGHASLRSEVGDHATLLDEAAQAIARAALRPEDATLPALLAIEDRDTRARLLPVLGSRARWLGRLVDAFAWVSSAAAGDDVADLARAFEEGERAVRIDALARLRRIDPGRARELLADGIAREKPEIRAEALETLREGLSPDDEPLLEACTRDRSALVRAVAADQLARLPGSALAVRIEARASSMLVFDPRARRLAVAPPAAYEKAWSRDGIEEGARHGEGQRGAWLRQHLALVAPSRWSTRFALDPSSVLDALHDDPHRADVIRGLVEASVRFDDPAWAAALFAKISEPSHAEDVGLDRLILLPAMRADDAERAALAILRAALSDTRAPLDGLAQALPRHPWSDAFARSVLDVLRRALEADPHLGYRASTILRVAALRCPRGLLAHATETAEALAASSTAHAVERFREILRLRKALPEESTP